MKNKFIRFAKWSEEYWLSIVIVLTLFIMCFFCIVMASWLIGYYANALLGMRFDLGSCWQGVTITGGAFAVTMGLAKAAWTKYRTDSEFNTVFGYKPKGGE